jgi:hypothetical protein
MRPVGRYLLLLFTSDQDPFHLIETHRVAAPIVELGGAGTGVVGHSGGLLQSAAVLQISRNPGGPAIPAPG